MSGRKLRGFTIVELLIVIVVIAILATITVVAYNGIQQRAHNDETIAAVKAYQQAFAMYVTDHGKYPDVNYGTFCVGQGYEDSTGDGVADCGAINQDWRGTVNDTLNNELKPYLGSQLPNINTEEIKTYDDTFVGAIVNEWDDVTIDGKTNPFYMMYILQGSQQDCGLRVAQTNGTWPEMVYTDNNYSWSDTSSHSTMCVLLLPNP